MGNGNLQANAWKAHQVLVSRSHDSDFGIQAGCCSILWDQQCAVLGCLRAIWKKTNLGQIPFQPWTVWVEKSEGLLGGEIGNGLWLSQSWLEILQALAVGKAGNAWNAPKLWVEIHFETELKWLWDFLIQQSHGISDFECKMQNYA